MPETTKVTKEWLLELGGRQEPHTIGLGPESKGYFAYERTSGTLDIQGWSIYRLLPDGDEIEICPVPTQAQMLKAIDVLCIELGSTDPEFSDSYFEDGRDF
tara:strand:+ start:1871 stop:2173 length:303 start_codon:yes stop_codon:yes gene_type:complete